MIKNKLFRLVSVLHLDERAEVYKYLLFKLQEPNGDCMKLWKLLMKESQLKIPDAGQKTLLFHKLYGKKAAYDDAKMRKLMSKLCRLIENYLVQKRLEQAPMHYSQLLIESLESRSDYGLFMDFTKERLAELERRPYRGRTYFMERADLYRGVYFHQETAKTGEGASYFQQYVFNFERFFTITALQNGVEWLSLKKVKTEDGKSLLLDAAVIVADGTDDAEVPKLFLDLYRLYAGSADAEDIDRLRRRIEKGLALLEEAGQRMALKSAINYAIRFVNLGDVKYRRFLFELYKLGGSYGLFVHGDNSISSQTFINILAIALSEEEFDWSQAFIEKYGELLKANEKEAVIHYCQALYYYRLGMNQRSLSIMEDAMTETQLVPMRASPVSDLRVRLLQCRIKFQYLEWGKDTKDDFMGHARTFRRFLRGNTVYAESLINSYLQWIDCTKTIAKFLYNPNVTKAQIDSFKSEIMGQNILLKDWILEKIEGLLSRQPY